MRLLVNSYTNGHNIIDWSSRGQIAASFDASLVLWGPPNASDKETSTVLYELKNVTALKYGPGNKTTKNHELMIFMI